MQRNFGIITPLIIVSAFLPVLAHTVQPPSTERSPSVSALPDNTTDYPTPPSITTKDGQDCDGLAPQPGALTALLRKLVRGSHQEPGIQCPIPPVPDQSHEQEHHP
jgi:hypothetical protein